MNLEKLKELGEAPHWLKDEGFKTLSAGYLLSGETPKGMYQRVSKASSKRLNRPDLEIPFFDIIWKNWLCLSTPVASNMGTDRGLTISCNSVHVGDSTKSIFDKQTELAMLSKYGAGVGVYFGDLRAKGSPIKGTGGVTDSTIKWAKCYDSVISAVSQGNVRRGSAALYMPIQHGDIDEFLEMRRPTGDLNSRCLNLHHAVNINDDFMNKAINGDKKSQELWNRILTLRMETGEPYLFFSDNVNNQNPECYKDKGLKVSTSNICSEIYLYTDKDHSFVCCLSSMNLARWEEWKDTNAVELSIYFLDAVMEEYIQKAKHIEGFECAVRFAEKSRALGLGVLGWHSLLQERRLQFDSFDSMMLNAQIFKHIADKSLKASQQLAVEYGEPEWCKGHGIRNTHRTAIAPTVSNSLISGGLSAGIEPIAANLWVQNSAKGTFIRKNVHLERFLEEKGLNTDETWYQINKDAGSVLGIKTLSQEEKNVFLTAKEINQFALVKQASQRQKYICNGQSLNLFFGINSDPKYIHQVHLEAWKQGLKGLYYCRTESVLRADLASRSSEECTACSG